MVGGVNALILIYFSAGHPLNTLLPREVRLAPIFTVVNLVHSWKAFLAMVVI
jgi:hypothetical protein